jgi:hypothetical protein
MQHASRKRYHPRKVANSFCPETDDDDDDEDGVEVVELDNDGRGWASNPPVMLMVLITTHTARKANIGHNAAIVDGTSPQYATPAVVDVDVALAAPPGIGDDRRGIMDGNPLSFLICECDSPLA